MDTESLLFLLLFFGVPVLGIFLGVKLWQGRRLRKQWLAARGYVEQKGPPNWNWVVHHHAPNGAPWMLGLYQRPRRPNSKTSHPSLVRLQAPVPGADGITLMLTSAPPAMLRGMAMSVGRRMANFLSDDAAQAFDEIQEATTGDAAFDEAWMCGASGPDAMALLTPAVRARIEAFAPERSLMPSVTVRHGVLDIQVQRRLDMRGQLELVVALADTFLLDVATPHRAASTGSASMPPPDASARSATTPAWAPDGSLPIA